MILTMKAENFFPDKKRSRFRPAAKVVPSDKEANPLLKSALHSELSWRRKKLPIKCNEVVNFNVWFKTILKLMKIRNKFEVSIKRFKIKRNLLFLTEAFRSWFLLHWIRRWKKINKNVFNLNLIYLFKSLKSEF